MLQTINNGNLNMALNLQLTKKLVIVKKKILDFQLVLSKECETINSMGGIMDEIYSQVVKWIIGLGTMPTWPSKHLEITIT